MRRLEEPIKALVAGGRPAAAVADDDRGPVDRGSDRARRPEAALRLELALLVLVVEALAGVELVLEDRPGSVAADEGRRDVVKLRQAQFEQPRCPLDVDGPGFALAEGNVRRGVDHRGAAAGQPLAIS